MAKSIEDRYFTISLSLRDSERVRVHVHDNLRTGWGYTVSTRAENAARIRDLAEFVRSNRRSLDVEAERCGYGPLRWEAMQITEHRIEHHEDSYAWSGLINAPLEEMALAI